jgi:tetratricopeptide (TPR) repeat protein
VEETNAQETLRAYLQLQEQLHETQLAIEQSRKESRDAAAQSAEALAQRLQQIEKALSAQRARELEAMQSSNRVMLTVAGTFAAVGFVAMLLMAYFQWRTVHGLASISASLPAIRSLGNSPSVAALGGGDTPLVTVGPAAQSNVRLLGSLEQLEKRIYELEHTAHRPLNEPAHPDHKLQPLEIALENGQPVAAPNVIGFKSSAEHSGSAEANRITLLLGKGQSMLSLDNAEAALECFDEALELEPNNAEALIKKGTALERLQKLDEAIECYDRAIAADGSMTIAYLHKGGLFNRMERFNEALECYEQALRSQEKRHG